jgi:hypothetical protein
MGPLLLFSPNYAADTVYKVSVPVQGSSEKMFRLIMDVDKMPVWCVVECRNRSRYRCAFIWDASCTFTFRVWPSPSRC